MPRPGRLLAAAALVAAFLAVFAELTGRSLPPAVWVAIFAAYFAVNGSVLKRSGGIILSASLVAFIFAWTILGHAYWEGISRAGFLFVFLMLMQYMADLAGHSPGIARAAELIVSRPQGQRYLFVTFGTHVFALFLQIGAVILIMSLLASRLKDAGEATVRSLTIAGMRGFAATAMWSPLSLGILIVFAHVTGVSYGEFVPFGLACAALFMLGGYWSERGRRSRVVDSTPMTRSEWGVLLRVVAIAVMLVLGGLAWVAWFKVSLLEGMFTVVLILGALWSAVSLATGDLTWSAIGSRFERAGASLANEVAVITGATIIGAVASGLISEGTGLQGAAIAPATAAGIALVAPAAIFAGGMLAINPVATVTFLVSALNGVWPEPSKLWLVFDLTWAWSMTAGATPFTANVLMTAQKMRTDGFTIAIRWNGRYTLSVLVLLSVVAAIGTYLSAV